MISRFQQKSSLRNDSLNLFIALQGGYGEDVGGGGGCGGGDMVKTEVVVKVLVKVVKTEVVVMVFVVVMW